MAYNQNNPLPRLNSALRREKADRKSGILRKSSPINNASQYGIHGVDELKYMPIIDDMHRKQDSPAHLDAEEKYPAIDDITQDDGKADHSKQKLMDQNKGLSRHGSMKGDQSATHKDYAHYKGTDPHYHGHDGESHGDQSATHRDYLHGNAGVSRKSSPLNEDYCAKSAGKGGCVKQEGGSWRVISNKTGKLWDAKYSSKSDAEAALRAYHAG